MLRGGDHKARTLTRVRILIHAHEGMGNKEIVTTLGTSTSTVRRIRHAKQFAENGLHAALYEAPRPGIQRSAGGASRVDDAVAGGQTRHTRTGNSRYRRSDGDDLYLEEEGRHQAARVGVGARRIVDHRDCRLTRLRRDVDCLRPRR